MQAKLSVAKETIAKMSALSNRYVKVLEQREEAHKEDMRSRQLLTDPSLPSDRFTAIANQARAAQRRRANLHDKALEIEEAVRKLAADLQQLATELLTDEMPQALPADAAAQADQTFLENTDTATEKIVEEGFVEVEETTEAAA